MATQPMMIGVSMTAPQAPVPPSPVAPVAPAPVAPVAPATPVVTAKSASDAPQERRGRGRSRPADVVARDEKVLSAVTAEGITREKIAEVTGLDSVRVYQSLWRLRRDGKVVRGRDGRSHRWMLASAAGSETAIKAELDATS